MAVLAFYCSFENIKQSKSACFVAQPEKGREEVTLNDEIFPVFPRRIFRSGGWRRAKNFEENGKQNGKFIDLIYGFKREVNFSVEFRIESFEVKHEELSGMLVTFLHILETLQRTISFKTCWNRDSAREWSQTFSKTRNLFISSSFSGEPKVSRWLSWFISNGQHGNARQQLLQFPPFCLILLSVHWASSSPSLRDLSSLAQFLWDVVEP